MGHALNFVIAAVTVGFTWQTIGDLSDEQLQIVSWNLLEKALPEDSRKALPEDSRKALPERVRALYFGAEWCRECVRMHSETLQPLRRNGWGVRGSEQSHIQLIDADHQPELVQQYGITQLPTTVFLQGNVEIRRVVGFIDRWKISEIFQGDDDEQ